MLSRSAVGATEKICISDGVKECSTACKSDRSRFVGEPAANLRKVPTSFTGPRINLSLKFRSLCYANDAANVQPCLSLTPSTHTKRKSHRRRVSPR